MVLAAGEGTPAAPADRAAAQGALPGRQRAAAGPGAGPAGRPGPDRPGPGRGQRLLPRPTRWSRTSATAHTCRSSRATRWAPPAAWPTCGTGSTGGRCWSATPTRTSPTRRSRPGPDVAALLDGWDGRTVRLLGLPAADPAAPGTFAGHRFAGFSLLPWRLVRDLPAGSRDLVRAVWRPAEAAGALEVVPYPGTFFDTGTPADYLAANLHAAAGGVLVDGAATVTGRCVESVDRRGRAGATATCPARVVWPGATVRGRRAAARRDPGRRRPDRALPRPG